MGKNIRRKAHELKNNQTPAELRFRQLLIANGLSAKPQYVISGYIADFYNTKRRLVIEIDGSSHRNKAMSDEVRTQRLQNYGCRVIRFTNEQVFLEPERVIADLRAALELPPIRASKTMNSKAPTWQRIQAYTQTKSREAARRNRKVKSRVLGTRPEFIGKIVVVNPNKEAQG